VSEEADESQGWLEFIDAAKLLTGPTGRSVVRSDRAIGDHGIFGRNRAPQSSDRVGSSLPRINYSINPITPINSHSNYQITQLPDSAYPLVFAIPGVAVSCAIAGSRWYLIKCDCRHSNAALGESAYSSSSRSCSAMAPHSAIGFRFSTCDQ